MFRMLKWLALVLMFLLVAAVGVVLTRQDRVFEVPYPELQASTDPEKIARGRYLVEGPAHCLSCHGDPEARARGASVIPLSGGYAFHLPLGTYFAPNLTSDPETGLGRYSDGEIARVLRHAVLPNGQAMLPIMAFSNLADDDVIAILSYLRTQPPVKKRIPPRSLSPLGRAVHAFVFEPAKPGDNDRPVPTSVPPAVTPAYGEYLATSVANCVGCHTKVDLRDGSFVGPRFAGGFVMEEPGGTFVTPNLTSHKDGKLTGWTEDDFVARFRAGGNPASPMPWSAFRTMTDDDLRALFRFLRSVPAAEQPEGD